MYHEKRAINYHDRGTNSSASSPLNPWLHLRSVGIEAEDLRHSFGTVENGLCNDDLSMEFNRA